MSYEKPEVIIYDEEVMNEIEALATSSACKCGNGQSQDGSKRSKA